ncbi:MAG: biotin/lipoyl-binding protein [Armatimonadetes bacterium]|nr:biotin/lipoyl-binding protein [Armatimonadota bacterium]
MSLDRAAVRRAIDLLKQSGATELEIAEDGRSVRVRRAGAPADATALELSAEIEPAAEPLVAAEPEPEPDSHILARMVGLFHRGRGPDAEPLVEVGDTVTEGQVVATIEALRKLTDVTSPVEGVIAEVLVEDGEPVEYGQKLFAVRAAEEREK